VSPVFRHGGLRLYLLKLLDEAPRHGYEVIRLLQDRFMGVYSPSPGTIYPRLARLEEEGLVTHDEVDGKKVYRITDKGREEIQARLDDLAELEEELTESVRDIAREVTEDVRDTVRNLREELTWMTRDVRRESRERAREDARERAQRARDEVRESARQARDEARQGAHGPEAGAHGPEADVRDAARQAREALREQAGQARDEARQGRGQREEARARPGRYPGDWAAWAATQDWPNWTGWRGRPGERPWGGRGWPGAPGLDAALFRDLERLAVDFARELRKAAWNTESVGENALSDLRSILEDALARIKTEVFGGATAKPGPEDQASEAEDQTSEDPQRSDSADS
jgi:DNA-binding PadR family transcriptional regulator